MGIIERWNLLAKKRIYINDSFEIGVGRLCFSALLFSVQVAWGLLVGASPVEIMPSLLTWLVSLKQKPDNSVLVEIPD